MRNCNPGEHPEIRDYGPKPFVFNIAKAFKLETALNGGFYSAWRHPCNDRSHSR